MILCALAASALLVPTADTLSAAGVTDVRRGMQVLEAGTPVYEISEGALARSGAKDLHEVLRTLPGLTVQDYGGLGGMKTVSVRGLGATHTALCVDGIMEQNVQQGSIDLSQYDLSDTGGLTVEIGSPDNIFKPAGAFFSGGLLSIKSKTPEFGRLGTIAGASVTYGSFSTWKPVLRIDRRLSRGWSVSANASYLSSRGDYPFVFGKVMVTDPDTGDITFEERTQRRLGSDVSSLKTSLRVEGHTSSGGEIRAGVRYNYMGRGLPGADILYSQDPTERLWDRDLSAYMSYEKAWRLWRLRTAAAYKRSATRYTNTSALYATPADDRYLQQSASLSGILQRRFRDGLVLVLSQDLDYAVLDANTPACPQPSRLRSATALSAQYSYGGLRVTASASALIQHEWILRPTAAHPSAAADIAHVSPSLSASYAILPDLHVRAFVKDGFRTPTFNDLYYDRVGSIHLVPEKAFQTGAGITWRPLHGDNAMLAFTVDYYHNLLRDKIIAVPTMFVWRMRNLGLVRMDGVDSSVSLMTRLGSRLILRSDASWSFLKAVDVTDPSAGNYGHQIQYTPHNSGAFSVSLSGFGASLSYTLCAVGRRWYLPENVAAYQLPGYLDHTVALRKTFTLGPVALTLAAEALNLAGVNYQIVRSYPMPGRHYRITLKINTL